MAQGIVQLGRNVRPMRNSLKTQVAPVNRRPVHLETAANGQPLFAAVSVNQHRLRQHLADFLQQVLSRGRPFVWSPITELRETQKTGLLAERDYQAACCPRR